MEKVIKIEGMSCKHCQGRVTKLLEGTEGVRDVSVSLEKKEAFFICDEGVEITALIDGINALGFTAAAL